MRKKSSLLLLLSPLLAFAADTDIDTNCRADLKRLGAAVRAYRIVHDDKNPAQLSDLYYDGLVESLGDFNCATAGAGMASEIDTKSDYTFEALPGTENLLVREKIPRPGRNDVLGVFADGTIKAVAGLVGTPATNTGDQTASSSTPSVTDPTAAFEHETDRPGGDYRSFALDTADPGQCAARCAKENLCRAWTYFQPRAQGEKARCRLKDRVPAPVSRQKFAISGVRAP